MNIALEDTKEFVDGKLRRNYGDAFVRGNNGKLFALMSSISITVMPLKETLRAPARILALCLQYV